MSGILFAPGKTYLTRGGCEALVYAVDGGGLWPIHGAVWLLGAWEPASWTCDGKSRSAIRDNDLLPPTPIDEASWRAGAEAMRGVAIQNVGRCLERDIIANLPLPTPPAAPAPEPERLREAGACDGCGSTQSMADLRAAGHVACCPERKMLTASEWRARALAAEAERDAKIVSLATSIERMGSDAYANGYRAGREAGLREAAKVARARIRLWRDECAKDEDNLLAEVRRIEAIGTSEAIRALIEKEPADG